MRMIQRSGVSQKQKMSRRTILVVAAASSILAIIVVLFFVFNIGNIRHGFAATGNPKLDAKWTVISNDGTIIHMELGIRTNIANKNLGPSTFIFKFNPNDLSFHSGGTPGTINTDYVWANGFAPGANSNYSATSKVTQPMPGYIYVLLDFTGGKGTPVSNTSAYTPVIDVYFTILNPSYNSGLTWAMHENNAPTFDDIFDDRDNPFDQGTLSNMAVIPPPPIHISLTAGLKNDETELEWSTSSEYNTAYFTIQRSKDSINFDSILTMNSEGASQNSQDYTDFDKQPISGISYYRVLLVDLNGNTDTSNIVSVNTNNNAGTALLDTSSVSFELTSISPTVFHDNTTVNYKTSNGGGVRMRVVNMSGNVMVDVQLTASEGVNSYNITNTASWQPGVYTVTMTSNGKTTYGRMVKQ